MFHQNTALQRRAGQRRILATGPRIREYAGRQFTQEEAARPGNEQEERRAEWRADGGEIEEELRQAVGRGLHVDH